MAAGVDVDLVIRLMGKRGGTCSVDIAAGLRLFGLIPATTKRIRWDGVSKPPAYAILHARFGPTKKSWGHWLLNYAGVIHDPEMEAAGKYCGDATHRFTSYIEFALPQAVSAPPST